MLTGAHYELASSSSSAALTAATSSLSEPPTDPGGTLPYPTAKTSPPVYLRHHPKKYRLSPFGSATACPAPSASVWNSFEVCPPPLSHPEQLHQPHQPLHHHSQHQQHHHQQHHQHQQQQYQQARFEGPVVIKTEAFSAVPYSPSAAYGSPAYASSLSYSLPTATSCPAPMVSHEAKGYFAPDPGPPMPPLQTHPGDGAYPGLLHGYNCAPAESYLSSGLTPPGKSEPGLSPFYLTTPTAQVGSGAAEMTAVYPADSSSFAGPPHGFDRASPVLQSAARPSGKPGAAAHMRSSHCPERELSLYKNKMESKLCDVCQDTAAGFHCGAFVCEACKKFFIRSWKADNSQRYQCTKSEACKITKDTRTHCQRCRYKKCIELRMVPPNMRPTESPDISAIPCRVCGAQSSGFHFGAITCEGCKGFFRRTIHERSNHSYTCSKASKCPINVQTRNNCKACRFVKCLSVGMSKTGSRIGRQPNAIKHLCGEEIRAQQKQQQQHLPPSMPSALTCAQPEQTMTPALMATAPQDQLVTPPALVPAVQHHATSSVPGEVTCAEATSSAPTAPCSTGSSVEIIGVESLPSNAWTTSQFRDQVITAWEKRHIDVGKQEPTRVAEIQEDMGIKEVLDIMMARFLAHTIQLVNFAKRSPDFYVLTYPFQSNLVTEAIYPFTLIQLSVDFDLEHCDFNYFDFSKHERAIILSHFPSYEVICQHLIESGRMIKMCGLDRVELALLSYLEFIRGDFSYPPGQPEQSSRALAIFERLQERAFAALQEYIARERPNSALCGPTLEQIHRTLLRMNREHFEVVHALPEAARSSFSGLFNDMFRLSNRPNERESAAVNEADSTTAGACPSPYVLPAPTGHHMVSTTHDDDIFS